MEHSSISYLKSSEIGGIINDGLLQTFMQQPSHPVTFLAQYLLNYQQQQDQLIKVEGRLDQIQQLKQDHELQKESFKIRQQENKQQSVESQSQYDQFITKIEQTHFIQDLFDKELCQFIQERYQMSGVYIGKVDYQYKQTNHSNIDENSHLDLEKNKIIRYIGASDDHQSMKLKVLDYENQGVTGELFIKPEEQEEDNDQQQQVVENNDNLKQVYISEVSYNPKVHFFNFPKLGSYLCLLLKINKCMLEKELNNAVEVRMIFKDNLVTKQTETNERIKQIIEQIREKEEHYQINQNEENEETIDNDQEYKDLQEEKSKLVEELENMKEEPFKTEQVMYVVGIDTMGLEKEITDRQANDIQNLLQFVQDHFNKKEQEMFSKEIDLQIKYNSNIQNQGGIGQIDDSLTAIVDSFVSDRDIFLDQFKENPRQFDYEKQCLFLDKLKETLIKDNNYQMSLKDLLNKKIVKFQNAFRFGLFTFKFEMNEVCVPNEGYALDWRRVKDSLFQDSKKIQKRLESQSHRGQQKSKPLPYHSIQSLLSQQESIVLDEILNYNIWLWLFVRVAQMQVQLRKEDVLVRKEIYETKRQEKEEKNEKNVQINELYVEKLNEAKAALTEEEIETFDAQDFQLKFYEENPLNIVEELPQQDIDLDYEEEVEEKKEDE